MNLINLIPHATHAHNYIRLSSAARADISWWIVGLSKFHGSTPFGCDVPVPSHMFATDSCLRGGGGHFMNDWFFVNWELDEPHLLNAHINVLELQSVLVAAKRWGSSWSGKHILLRSDNVSVVSAVNSGTSRSIELLSIVQELFWLAVEFDFRLTASYLPGKLNVLSDAISRMDELDFAVALYAMLGGLGIRSLICNGHMSYAACAFLQDRWEVALRSYGGRR